MRSPTLEFLSPSAAGDATSFGILVRQPLATRCCQDACQPLAPMTEVNRAQKRKAFELITSFKPTDVEELSDSWRSKYQNQKPVLIVGNGPVPPPTRRSAYAFINRHRPIVIAMNNFLDQAPLKKIRPHIVAITRGTRKRAEIVKWCHTNRAPVLVTEIARDRSALWQPLAPLHVMRVKDAPWERVRRASSITSGFSALGIVRAIWPTRRVTLVGFGGRGHADDPNWQMWESIRSEHDVLLEILRRPGSMVRHMHIPSLEVKPSARKPMAPPGQPLAPRKGPGQLERQFCPKCFILAECHAVGNGRKRCVSCSKTYKAGAVPSRVPACPLCDGYSVVFNGESLCTSCNKGFSAVML